jgi:hypothetical protein
MPFANRAYSTKIDKLLDDIDKQLERVQYAFIMLAALVFAADDASFYYVDAWKEGDEDNPARDRLCALITMARDKSEELGREIDGAFKVLADRATWFVCWTQNGDANAKVDEGIDEAMFVLESAGVRPLILLFDEDEVKRLGEKPLARLVALQERAAELIKAQTVEAAVEASEVLGQALDLAKLLAEGEDDRDWTDDDQEPEAGEDEGAQEGEPGEVIEAGQEGEAQRDPAHADTTSGSKGEPGEVAEGGEETPPEAGNVAQSGEAPPEAGEQKDRGGKPTQAPTPDREGRRGRKK